MTNVTEVVRTSNWSYDNPKSYPDEILLLPYRVAVNCLLERYPYHLHALRRSYHTPHVLDGVGLPLWISRSLSASLKYMFFSRPNPNEAQRAWNEFANRLRWQCYFAQTPQETNLLQDFVVPHTTKTAPRAPEWVEKALGEGEILMRDNAAKITRSKGHLRVQLLRPLMSLTCTSARMSYLSFLPIKTLAVLSLQSHGISNLALN